MLEDRDCCCCENSKKKRAGVDGLMQEVDEANNVIDDYKRKLDFKDDLNLKQDLLDYNREVLELRKVIANLEDEKSILEQKLEQQFEVKVNKTVIL